MANKPKLTDLVLAPPPLWERQHGESNRAFAAFVVYRDLPSTNRTLRMVRDILYPDSPWAERSVADWAKKHIWENRVIAWENYLDLQRREIQIETLKTMAERHITAAISLLEKGIEALSSIDINSMDADDARRMIVDAAKLERLSRGLSTEKLDQGGTSALPDLSGYSDEEVRRLENLAGSVSKGAGEKTP